MAARPRPSNSIGKIADSADPLPRRARAPDLQPSPGRYRGFQGLRLQGAPADDDGSGRASPEPRLRRRRPAHPDDLRRRPGEKYVQGGTKRVYPEFEGDSRDGRSWLLWSTLWLTQCRRIVRPGGMGMIFSDWRQLPNAIDALQAGGFVYRGIVVWAKGADCRVGHTGYFRPQAEYVVWGSSGHLDKAPGRGPWPGVVQVRVDHREKLHMTGKPLAVMQHLVQAVAAGGLVVDPFACSGSTLAACIRDGRRGLGFEMSAEYVGIANRRLDRERAGLGVDRSAVLEEPGHVQRELGLCCP